MFWSLSVFVFLGVVRAHADSDSAPAAESELEILLKKDRQLSEKAKEDQRIKNLSRGSELRSSLPSIQVTPHFQNPLPQDFLPEKDDDKEKKGDEEKEDPNATWLVDGVMKLSGKYSDEKDTLFQPHEDTEEEDKFYSSTLLIDQMAAYRNEKREEKEAKLSESEDLSDEEDSFTLENILSASKHSRHTSWAESIEKNPFITQMRRGVSNAYSEKGSNSRLGGRSWTGTSHQTAPVTSVLGSDSNNPYLNQQKNFEAAPIFKQKPSSTASSLKTPFAPQNTTQSGIPSGMSNQQAIIPEAKRRYTAPENPDKKYFRRIDKF